MGGTVFRYYDCLVRYAHTSPHQNNRITIQYLALSQRIDDALAELSVIDTAEKPREFRHENRLLPGNSAKQVRL